MTLIVLMECGKRSVATQAYIPRFFVAVVVVDGAENAAGLKNTGAAATSGAPCGSPYE